MPILPHRTNRFLQTSWRHCKIFMKRYQPTKHYPRSRLSARDWSSLGICLVTGGTLGYSILMLCIQFLLHPAIVRESALRIVKYTVLVENLLAERHNQSLPKGIILRPESKVIADELISQQLDFDLKLRNSMKYDYKVDRRILRDQKPLVDIWGGHWVELRVPNPKYSTLKSENLWLYYPERLSTSLWYLPILRIFSILTGCLLGLILYIRLAIEQPLTQIIGDLENNELSPVQPLLAVRGSYPLRKLTKSINTLLDRINTTTRVRRELIQGLTHDLGGPHSRLMLRTEQLAQHTSGRNQELAISMLCDLQQLRQITDQLAQLGTAEVPEQERSTCALDSICNRITSRYRNIMIHVDVPRIMIRVNNLGLERALSNLIDNALEHGGLPIEISAEAHGKILYLRVKDHGRESPHVDIDSLSNQYVIVDPLPLLRPRHGRRGLGLNIVNRFCKEHGGKLRLTKNTSGGLQAELQLPILMNNI